MTAIRAWRIVKARFARTAFTGDGARLFPGRWNRRGTPMVYLAGSVSLAMLELLVHLPNADLLHAYRLFEVTIPTDLIQMLPRRRLPKRWNAERISAETQSIGSNWVRAGRSAVLEVPSAIVPTESNYLLNPRHDGFRRIRIGPARLFRFDSRLHRPDA